MTQSARPKRPFPERQDPVRGWTRGATASSASTQHSDAPDSETASREVAYESVNNAYRIIDEYLRQGQQFAERLWLPLVNSKSGGSSPLNAPERLMRAVGDLTMAWAEVLEDWKGNAGNVAPPGAGAGPFTAGRVAKTPAEASARSTGSPLSVFVEAHGQTELTVDVQDLGAAPSVTLSALYPLEGDLPPITAVSVTRAPDGRFEVRIRVPEAQPSGAYGGMLIDTDARRPRGTVSLRLKPRAVADPR